MTKTFTAPPLAAGKRQLGGILWKVAIKRIINLVTKRPK
jgi:hypothetical protein